MKTRTIWGIGVVAVVGVGVVVAGTYHPQPHATAPVVRARETRRPTPTNKVAQPISQPAHKPTVPMPAKTPVIPSVGSNSTANATTSLTALTHKEGVANPVGPLDVVSNLAKPTQQWAFATEAAQGTSTGYTLWFGEHNTPSGPWTWIPSTLPGALSTQLPPAVYRVLQWAYDLHAGQSGPTLFGTVNWNTIKGLVGEPEGWTAQEADGTLTITVWERSYDGSFHGFYGIQSDWYVKTINAGTSGLSMIVANPGPMTTIAQDHAS